MPIASVRWSTKSRSARRSFLRQSAHQIRHRVAVYRQRFRSSSLPAAAPVDGRDGLPGDFFDNGVLDDQVVRSRAAWTDCKDSEEVVVK